MTTCPSLERLEVFLSGESTAGDVVTHLPLCSDCSARLEGLRSDRQLAQELAAVVRSETSAPPPDRVAGYDLEDEIHRGGQGVVYRAWQQSMKRQVAVKLLLEGVLASERTRQRFEREIELAASLDHPAVVTLFDSGMTNGGRHFFAMELVDDATTVTDYAERGDLDIQARLELFCRVCAGVHYGHQKGVIHCDLKPQNILVTPDGDPKIIDFGIARALEAGTPERTVLTRADQVLGTLQYMSPEQIGGRRDQVDTRTDVYALGIVLFELMSGSPPYRVDTTPLQETVRLICEEPPPKLSATRPALRGDLDWIAIRALEKDPGRRYPSVLGLQRDLERYLQGLPIEARPPTLSYVARKLIARHKVACAVASAVLVVLIAATLVSVWFAVHESEAREQAEFQAYALEMQAAAGALEVRDVRRTMDHLWRAPQAFRNWEWRHLSHRVDNSVRTFEGHGSPVLAVAFDATGKRLVSGGGDPAGRAGEADTALRVWDVRDGKPIAVLRGHTRDVTGVRFLPGDQQIVSASLDGTLRFWDADRGLELSAEPFGASITAMAMTSDGGWFALGVVIDDDTGALLWHRETGTRHLFPAGPVRSTALTEDGTLLAIGTDDGAVRVCDTASKATLFEKRAHGAAVRAVAFSGDGARLASAGGLDGVVRTWDSRSGTPVHSMGDHRWWVNAVVFDPRGRWLATGSGTIRLWDLEAGQPRAVLLSPHRHLALTVSRDGGWLATGDTEGLVKLWDTESGGDVPTLRGHQKAVYAMAFFRDGRRLVTTGADGGVLLWDVTRRHLLRSIEEPGRPWAGQNSVHSLAVSPDGEQVLALSRHGFLQRWVLATREAELHRLPERGRALAVSLDGRWVATGGQSGALYLRSAETLGVVKKIAAHTDEIQDVAFHPDSDLVAAASRDDSVSICEVATGRVSHRLPSLRFPSMNRYSCLAFSPNGKFLATGQGDMVTVWRTRDWHWMHSATHANGGVHALSFSPDSTRLVSGNGDYAARVWDVETGTLVATLRRQNLMGRAALFSPVGDCLVTAASRPGHPGDIFVWATAPSPR